MTRTKSSSVSPLATDEFCISDTATTVPPSRCIAAWNEHDVRVDGS